MEKLPRFMDELSVIDQIIAMGNHQIDEPAKMRRYSQFIQEKEAERQNNES